MPCMRPISHVFDAQYLERLRNNDPATGQHFALYFATFLNWRLRIRFRDPEVLKDIRQETLRRVLEAICKGALRDPAKLESFVGAVSNNVVFEYWRAAKRGKHEEIMFDIADGNSDPERDCRKLEVSVRLRAALETLSVRDQQVLRLMFFEGLGASEISALLRVTEAYVRVLIHRAIVRLRRAAVPRELLASA